MTRRRPRPAPLTPFSSLRLFWTCMFLLSALVGRAWASSDATLANRTIERTIQLRTHSIYAPYIDQDLQNRWWDFGADAYINTNKYIRLTRPVTSQMGWLWSRLPVTPQNYVIEVEFKIGGDATHLYGDGMAMWLTTARAQEGPVFGNMDKFNGLGIFLDTYANARHAYSFPRVYAMLGDGETLFDFGNDGEAHSIGACSANFRRSSVATKLKVTYIMDSLLDVKVQYKGWDEWSDCFSVDKIKLPPSPFLGFSAMTGDVFDAHDIITVSSYSAVLSAADAQRNKIHPGYGSRASLSPSGTWSGFFVRLILCFIVCGAGWFGYRKWTERDGRYHGGLGISGKSLFGRGGNIGGFGAGFYSNGKRF